MKKLLIGLVTLVSVSVSVSAFASEAIAQESVQEEVVVVIGEEKKIAVEEVDVSVIHSDEKGEPLSYLIKKNDGSIKILGVIDDIGDNASGIVNAYAGFQTMFGVNAGLSLFKTIEIGVHARSNSLGREGILYPSVIKTGYHANIKFRPVSALEIYAGMKWNTNYHSVERNMGYSETHWKGSTTEYVGGVRFNIDRRQSLGIEAGVAKGLLTKTVVGDPFTPESKKYKAPVFNLTYRITLFNH